MRLRATQQFEANVLSSSTPRLLLLLLAGLRLGLGFVFLVESQYESRWHELLPVERELELERAVRSSAALQPFLTRSKQQQ